MERIRIFSFFGRGERGAVEAKGDAAPPSDRGQNSFEYLILMGALVLIAVLVIFLMRSSFFGAKAADVQTQVSTAKAMISAYGSVTPTP